MTRRVFSLVTVVTALTLGGLFLEQVGPLRSLEWLTYDVRLEHLPPRRLDERIALVAVDRESNQRFGRWPWDRSVHADLIDRLSEAGAKVIALDVSFSGATDSDAVLARAVRRAGTVVLARTFELDSRGEYAPDDIPRILWDAAGGDRGLGSPLVRLESDGKLRRLALVRLEPDLRSFGVLVLERYTGERFVPHLPGLTGPAQLGGRVLEVEGRRNNLWLDFPSELGPLHSYAAVVSGAIPPETFRDKIVLVGSSSDFNDFKLLPDGRRVPGFIIHAALLDNVLGGWFIRPVPLPGWLVGTVLCLVASVFLAALPYRRASLAGLSLSILYCAAAWWLFAWGRISLPIAVPTLMVWTLLAMDLIGHSRRLHGVLGRFMPGRDIEAMVHQPERLEQVSQTREVTVLFADLRDFTSLSEARTPEQVREVVHEFHCALGEVFSRHGGYVCDFQGDAQMVVFGLEGDDANHARSALQAAAELGPALHGVAYGVGICTGKVSVGYLRGGRHLQYTVLGDTTNTAARLQGKTRELGKTVILSHTTAEAAELAAGLVPLEPVRLKGKARPHPIYTLEL